MDQAALSLDEYNSIMGHPYVVTLSDADWVVQKMVGFQTESEARAFARGRPEPVIYLAHGRGSPQHLQAFVASRVLVPHPAPPDGYLVFVPRDDFAENPA